MPARCLRCGAGNEWIEGRPTPFPSLDGLEFEAILGAVARGWCDRATQHKAMDATLAVAIAKEVQKLFGETS